MLTGSITQQRVCVRTSDLKDATPEERHAVRQERSLPVLETYSKWLHLQRSRTLPKSLVGQAIAYKAHQPLPRSCCLKLKFKVYNEFKIFPNWWESCKSEYIILPEMEVSR
ncbi:transposase [Paenibacillus sp. FSL W8-0194]|uniref:IS66 family transposase n=1 Tax=Paenibacillus sp. FSL W8-0194 TaxID=2921711 RepID=UPI0030DC0461